MANQSVFHILAILLVSCIAVTTSVEKDELPSDKRALDLFGLFYSMLKTIATYFDLI